jgi:hypothetical protein
LVSDLGIILPVDGGTVGLVGGDEQHGKRVTHQIRRVVGIGLKHEWRVRDRGGKELNRDALNRYVGRLAFVRTLPRSLILLLMMLVVMTMSFVMAVSVMLLMIAVGFVAIVVGTMTAMSAPGSVRALCSCLGTALAAKCFRWLWHL